MVIINKTAQSFNKRACLLKRSVCPLDSGCPPLPQVRRPEFRRHHRLRGESVDRWRLARPQAVGLHGRVAQIQRCMGWHEWVRGAWRQYSTWFLYICGRNKSHKLSFTSYVQKHSSRFGPNFVNAQTGSRARISRYFAISTTRIWSCYKTVGNLLLQTFSRSISLCIKLSSILGRVLPYTPLETNNWQSNNCEGYSMNWRKNCLIVLNCGTLIRLQFMDVNVVSLVPRNIGTSH